MAVGEKGKQLAELAPCTFAACDRSQLAATSCREQSNLHMTCTQLMGTSDFVSRPSRRAFVFFHFDYGNNDNCGSCNVTFKTLKKKKKRQNNYNALDTDFAKIGLLNNQWRPRFSE